MRGILFEITNVIINIYMNTNVFKGSGAQNITFMFEDELLIK